MSVVTTSGPELGRVEFKLHDYGLLEPAHDVLLLTLAKMPEIIGLNISYEGWLRGTINTANLDGDDRTTALNTIHGRIEAVINEFAGQPAQMDAVTVK